MILEKRVLHSLNVSPKELLSGCMGDLDEKEEIERLLQTKRNLEDHIADLEDEIKETQLLLDIVNKYITERSLKKAEISKGPSPIPGTVKAQTAPKPLPTGEMPPEAVTGTTEGEYEQVIPLRTADGTMLMNLYVGKQELRIVPSENIKFKSTTPPFQQFLINKVLMNMAAKDREDAVAGTISPDEMLTYRVVQDGDIIKEIIIRNYGDEKRAATLKNSIRWTFEKMREKIR